jgi:predicted DNA-binding transcriptional regulator AlpA
MRHPRTPPASAAPALESLPVVIHSPRDALPGWPRGLREDWAAAYVGISSALLRSEMKAGRFPAPIQLTVGRIAWLRDDLDAWLDRKAGRVAQDDSAEWLK